MTINKLGKIFSIIFLSLLIILVLLGFNEINIIGKDYNQGYSGSLLFENGRINNNIVFVAISISGLSQLINFLLSIFNKNTYGKYLLLNIIYFISILMIFFSYFGIYESKLITAIANAISSKGQGGVILSFILCGIDMLMVMISLTLSGNDSN